LIKCFEVQHKRSDLTREQFVQYWKGTHGPLFASKCDLPGMRKYIQNHPIDAGPEFESEVDGGVVEFWWDDVKSLQAFPKWLRTTDNGKDAMEDGKRFIAIDKQIVFPCEEHVFKE